jgi:ubiquinone/menaquinone biosynthesis C-methylase UbiE
MERPEHHHHGAGGHRFQPERLHILKSEERRQWLPPERALQALALNPGASVVDVGAGTGFWTLPLSRLVGVNGTVYAVDVEPIMLEELRSLVREEGLENVRVVGSDDLAIPLPDGVADDAVVGFMLHEPSDPVAFVAEVARLLKPGGRMLVVDWQKWETEGGPPAEYRLSLEESAALLQGAGLDVREIDDPNPDVYVLIGTREH